MKIHPPTTLLLIASSLLAGPSGAARADEASKTFFMETYPEAFRVLEARFANVEGSCRIVLEADKRPRRHLKAEFAANGPSEKVVLHETRGPDGASLLDRVFAVDGGSFYSLTRKPGDPTYTIAGIGADDHDRVAYSNHFRKFLKAPFGIFGSRLIDALRSPHFRLLDAEWAGGKPGEGLFKVRYRTGQSPAINDVELTFDPRLSWVIRSGRIATSDMPGAAMTFAAEYDAASSRPYFPTSVRFKNVDAKVETCTFDRFEEEQVPAGEFGPRFFGMPNLSPRPSGGRAASYSPWFLGLGLMVLGVKCVARKAGSRARPRPQSA